MKSRQFKTGVALVACLATLWGVGGGGCASVPPERPDDGKIRRDSDKSFQNLQREEEQHGDTEGY